MRKSLLLAAAMLLVSLMVYGCSDDSPSGAGGQSAAGGKVHKLKWGHVSSATYPYHLAAEKVAAEVLEKTGGAVEITIYPSNQLGSQREMTESIQTGVIDIALSSSSVLSGYDPKVQILDLPFLFRDRVHAYQVFDGPVGDEIFSGISREVAPVVAVWENGVRNLLNRKQPVTKPADMAGMKIRVMESKAYIRMMECLGANATPMSYGEVYTALQQGTVDGADNPYSSIYTERFYEVAPFITQSEHAYSSAPVLVSPRLEKKIGAENYAVLIQAIKNNTAWQRDLAISEENAYADKLTEGGAQIAVLSEEEKQAFLDKCKPVWDEFAGIVGRELIDKITAVGK